MVERSQILQSLRSTNLRELTLRVVEEKEVKEDSQFSLKMSSTFRISIMTQYTFKSILVSTNFISYYFYYVQKFLEEEAATGADMANI